MMLKELLEGKETTFEITKKEAESYNSLVRAQLIRYLIDGEPVKGGIVPILDQEKWRISARVIDRHIYPEMIVLRDDDLFRIDRLGPDELISIGVDLNKYRNKTVKWPFLKQPTSPEETNEVISFLTTYQKARKGYLDLLKWEPNPKLVKC